RIRGQAVGQVGLTLDFGGLERGDFGRVTDLPVHAVGLVGLRPVRRTELVELGTLDRWAIETVDVNESDLWYAAHDLTPCCGGRINQGLGTRLRPRPHIISWVSCTPRCGGSRARAGLPCADAGGLSPRPDRARGWAPGRARDRSAGRARGVRGRSSG